MILDKSSGSYVDIEHFNLFFRIGIEKLDSTEPITGNGHIHLFQLVEDVGRFEQRTNGLNYTYLITKSIQEKQFRLGLVPTESGSFNSSISFPPLYYNLEDNRHSQLYVIDSTCRETITYKSEINVNNKNVNYYIMAGICRSTLDGERRCYSYQPDSLPSYNIYAFHVKEP